MGTHIELSGGALARVYRHYGVSAMEYILHCAKHRAHATRIDVAFDAQGREYSVDYALFAEREGRLRYMEASKLMLLAEIKGAGATISVGGHGSAWHVRHYAKSPEQDALGAVDFPRHVFRVEHELHKKEALQAFSWLWTQRDMELRARAMAHYNIIGHQPYALLYGAPLEPVSPFPVVHPTEHEQTGEWLMTQVAGPFAAWVDGSPQPEQAVEMLLAKGREKNTAKNVRIYASGLAEYGLPVEYTVTDITEKEE
jgi:hypothetical protein